MLKAMDHHVRLAGVDDTTAAQADRPGRHRRAGRPAGPDQRRAAGHPGHRAAPVQVSYLGLPGTSAMPGVDWMLADRFVMPPELLPYCTEKPIYVPHCYQVSDRQREVAPRPERSRYGLPEDAFVFCSFNNNFKFTPEMFGAWMRIVWRCPAACCGCWPTTTPRARTCCAACRGAWAWRPERLIFAPRVSPAEYLARFQLADLVLDTFPYNAGTTASDALWMGTPIVTRSRPHLHQPHGRQPAHRGGPARPDHRARLADYESWPSRWAASRRAWRRTSATWPSRAAVAAVRPAAAGARHRSRVRAAGAGGAHQPRA
jgi:hypothetical protein